MPDLVGDGAASNFRTGRWRKLRVAFAVAALVVLVAVVKAGADTTADPGVRRLEVTLAGMPADATFRVALISDIHVVGPEMPPARLAAIVQQVNALSPDLVLIAGDLVSDRRLATRHYSTSEAIAPLAGLRPTLATVAVPGNHDHWRDVAGVRGELARSGIVVLANEARRFGPIAVGGLDDDFTGHADLPATLRTLARLDGGRVLLSHSPDPFPDLSPGFGLMLAGHTHCGQIRYPWGGSPAYMSRYGDRYACGVVRERGNVLVTGAGLGASVLPFRFGTRPEIWLIELRPAAS